MMADHGKSTRPRALESSASIIKLDFSSFGPAGPVQFYTCATLHASNTIHGDSGQAAIRSLRDHLKLKGSLGHMILRVSTFQFTAPRVPLAS